MQSMLIITKFSKFFRRSCCLIYFIILNILMNNTLNTFAERKRSSLKFLILQISDEKYSMKYEREQASWKCYAKRHGYDYIFDSSLGNSYSMWGRIFVDKYIESYDWILYSDVDAVVLNPRIKLELFLKHAPPSSVFAVKNMRCDIISSPIFIRGGPLYQRNTTAFLRKWKDLKDNKQIRLQYADQSALLFLMVSEASNWMWNFTSDTQVNNQIEKYWPELMNRYNSSYAKRKTNEIYFIPNRIDGGIGLGGFDGVHNLPLRTWPSSDYFRVTDSSPDLQLHSKPFVFKTLFTDPFWNTWQTAHNLSIICDSYWKHIDLSRYTEKSWCPQEEDNDLKYMDDVTRCNFKQVQGQWSNKTCL